MLKYGETFAVFNRLGDVEAIGLGEQGLYHRGTRHLSRLVLRMGDKIPQLLRSTIQDDNAFLTLDMMNPDVYRDGSLLLPRGAVHLFRSKFLWRDSCYDKLRLANFSTHLVETSISFDFAADYADIFQVRGAKRERMGDVRPAIVKDDSVILSYRGLDGELRCTRLQFEPLPVRISKDSVRFAVRLEPKEETSISVVISCEQPGTNDETVAVGQPAFDRATLDRSTLDRAKVDGSTFAGSNFAGTSSDKSMFDRSMTEALSSLDEDRRRSCRITTSNARFNAWLNRSEADIHMMIRGNPEGAYPYAGVPWFSTVFGRDGILTAMECLWNAPSIAKSVLKYLAETQATTDIPEQEAEPGKILHEMRHGEMANLKEVPFGLYYGSVDATPLFVMLAGAYLDRCADQDFIKEIWPNVLAALDWIDTYGDMDKDGFVEYRRKMEKGLIQQGWKDSHDSVFHRDGVLAPAPIALCEVQGYVYGAKQAAAGVAARFGFAELARRLKREAAALKDKFEREFWDDELGTYALALDGEKKPCRVRSSNAGHCLWTGIVSDEHAKRLADTLMGESSFCGWGIRTLDSREVRYNPMSYHNGSVWPHDNAVIASGLARYGYKQQALQILGAMFEASNFIELNRLPELFCGFHKRSEMEGPTLYPVACSPQAWAAGSMYMLLEACLGISIRPAGNGLELSSPLLPEDIDWIEFTNVGVGDHAVAVRLHRQGDGVSVDIQK